MGRLGLGISKFAQKAPATGIVSDVECPAAADAPYAVVSTGSIVNDLVDNKTSEGDGGGGGGGGANNGIDNHRQESASESGVLIIAEVSGGKKIKLVRLFVVTLLVSLMFVCAYMTLPQLACLCQIDSSEETSQEAVENIRRVVQSNQQCSDKLNRLSLELQENYEIRNRLQETLDMGRSIYIMALKKLKQVTEENRRLVLQLQSKASFKLLESNENEGEIHYQPYNLNNLRTTFTFENNDDIEEDAPITIQHPSTEKVNKEVVEQ